MAEINLTQTEADALIAMEKHAVNNDPVNFPVSGEKQTIDLVSSDKRESFLLDLSRATIEVKRVKYQNRARQIVPLVRLDMGGPPHRNPDDEDVPAPHLHLFREGFGDKWAYPAPTDKFTNLDDLWQTLTEFMAYCNITKTPNIVKGLFT